MTRVKICGITNLEDALIAADLGADMLGFNFYEKSPRYIQPGRASEISGNFRNRGSVRTVGVFVNETLESVLRSAEGSGIEVIQLHGDESPEFCKQVEQRSGLPVIKALNSGSLALEAAETQGFEKFAGGGILIDSFSPDLYGGSGKVADWEFARSMTARFQRVYLAGGLTAENVRAAISSVRPYAVDVASGVEAGPGKKDRKKMEAFIKNAKGK